MEIIETHRLPIFNWATDLEQGAKQQAINLALHPYTYDHVAILPDSHQGYGVPIGCVAATKAVIIPGAVGVDIGCFTGDTKIALLDGSQQSLKDLCNLTEPFWVYSLTEQLNPVPGRATAKKTRINANLMKITISGGAEIICTSDHKFMLKTGEYKEAKDLSILDSLMPLYRTYATRDGYERVSTRTTKGISTHRFVAEAIFDEIPVGYVIHHINENRFDNRPENLQIMSPSEHSKYPHTKKVKRLQSDEFKAHRKQVLSQNGFYDPKFYNKKKEVGIKNITTYMKENPEHFHESTMDNGKRGKPYLVAYNKSEKGRKKSSEIGSRIYKCDICGFSGKGYVSVYMHKKKEHSNHKVIKIEYLLHTEDVYCLEVETYHNFALAAGVFVHNCGMQAVKTNVLDLNTTALQNVVDNIKSRIPVGFSHRSESLWSHMPPGHEKLTVVKKEFDSACHQLGTLGGGNHFIEIQRGDDGYIWLMVHSGSRNLGKKVADHYIKMANAQTLESDVNIPRKWELDYLYVNSPDGQDYIKEMKYCLEFAKANRSYMMKNMCDALLETVPLAKFEPLIDIHHNYAEPIKIDDMNLVLHRKGATSAQRGQIGIIPGSQGTASYIVEGRGNGKSFWSCSHGSGRRMARGVAKRNLDLDEEREILDRQHIIHDMTSVDTLDEAPGAYKNIELVMENQKDLVKPLVRLTTRAVIKG